MAANEQVKMMRILVAGIIILSAIAATAPNAAGSSDNISVAGEATTTLTGGSTVTYSGSGGQVGGGGGGGGGPSGENFSNIEVTEKYDKYIYTDKVTSYGFTSSINPVRFVNITGNSSPGEIRTSVEVLRDTSSLVKKKAPGIVYKNANIWVGTSGFAVQKNIKEAVIRFRVNNTWMDSNGLSESDMRMYKWDGNAWLELETDAEGKDEIYSYFEARTDSFSSFSISGVKGTDIPSRQTPGITGITGTDQVPGSAQAEKTPGFEAALMITTIIAVCLSRRRKS